MATTSIPRSVLATEKPPHPRRWIPRSLRLFVAILILLTIFVAYRMCRRHLAISAIERLGGTVRMRTERPIWLAGLLTDMGLKSLDAPDEIFFGNLAIGDADLASFDEF